MREEFSRSSSEQVLAFRSEQVTRPAVAIEDPVGSRVDHEQPVVALLEDSPEEISRPVGRP
ncbi:MAG: hypothetical protein V5A40_15135 [Haloarculaceae archaeon]